MVFKVRDHYFKKAKKENFLARSVYKLEEIDKKFRVLKKGDHVLDLGYSPGSWVQYTSTAVLPEGYVVGIDIQEISRGLLLLGNVRLFEKDIFTVHHPSELGEDGQFNVVLSDMAPKTMGMQFVDQARSFDLVMAVFERLPVFLKFGGNLVIKVFEGEDSQKFFKEKRDTFKEIKYFRPKSTRSTSKEMFVIGLGYKGGKR
jgi:23S rRNA (uridine2552-2'-O)-methyltransferase